MKSPFCREARYYDLFHQDKDYASEAEEIRCRFPNAKTVLEIGSGTGNLTIELAKLGFEITCIEPSYEMLKYHKGGEKWLTQTLIQNYSRYAHFEQFDLVLATYDALNYVPFGEIEDVLTMIFGLGKDVYVEIWDPLVSIRHLTYKKADGCHRLRLGFRIGNIIHLWFIFWGQGLVITHHKLYLHRLYL